jgi:drug/metabolite transporter (DMT)-like permease
MWAVKNGHAFEVSVLLNLECVATTLLARFVFSESVSGKTWFAVALIFAGGILASIQIEDGLSISPAAFYLASACFLWALDTNLTRYVPLAPKHITILKGLIAGSFNLALGIVIGEKIASTGSLLEAIALGATSFGFGFVLFIVALQKIGAARTGAYFATAPFIGMLVAVLLLKEQPIWYHWLSVPCVLLGLIALNRDTQ